MQSSTNIHKTASFKRQEVWDWFQVLCKSFISVKGPVLHFSVYIFQTNQIFITSTIYLFYFLFFCWVPVYFRWWSLLVIIYTYTLWQSNPDKQSVKVHKKDKEVTSNFSSWIPELHIHTNMFFVFFCLLFWPKKRRMQQQCIYQWMEICILCYHVGQNRLIFSPSIPYIWYQSKPCID